MLTPVVHRSDHSNVGREVRAYDWQWLGLRDGEVEVDERACERQRPCSVARVAKGCTVLDRPISAPSSGGVRASWVTCRSGPHAREAGLWAWVDGTFRALGSSRRATDATLVWSSDAVAVWTERGFTLVDGQLHDRLVDSDADGILRAVLDEELGLVLVRRDAELVGVRMRDGVTLPPIVAAQPDWAAFDPDGTRVALAWSNEIAIFELDTGRERARWTTPGPLRGLAWRQDGRVLFGGVELGIPELAWDPELGVRVPEAEPSPTLHERLLRCELDPSWRWCKDGGTFIRVLDGAWLVSYEHDAAVASSGRYEVSEGGSWHGVEWWALRPRDQLLGPVVPLYLVDEFRAPTLEPFVDGAPMPELELERSRWIELVACAEAQANHFAPQRCPTLVPTP
jgi:hypothetical protein